MCSKNSDLDFNAKIKISGLLIDWFVKHIQTTEKRLCEFILTQSNIDSSIMAELKSILKRFTEKKPNGNDLKGGNHTIDIDSPYFIASASPLNLYSCGEQL